MLAATFPVMCSFSVLPCMLQVDEVADIAVEKINSLLEMFIGISDSELGMLFCKINVFDINVTFSFCLIISLLL